jgi:hypothetical protein
MDSELGEREEPVIGYKSWNLDFESGEPRLKSPFLRALRSFR